MTLVTSFTASTTVPTSNAGASTRALLISQLAPPGCSSLALTNLVQGSGTFSNSKSNALVLGSAGANTITDTGNGNCIIGGGGTNTITGTATDICITGPALNVANPCPVAIPPTTTTTQATTTTTAVQSNGVTAAAASDQYGTSYGGQERLTIAGSSAIIALTATIKISQATGGVTYNSEFHSFPAGSGTLTAVTSGGVITYTFTLSAGQAIPANYSSTLYAQYNGNGTTAHTTSGDIWSVTSKSGGITSTLTGTF